MIPLTYTRSPDGGQVLAMPRRASLWRRLFGTTRPDYAIRHAMPWMVASGAIVPGEAYGRKR